MKISKLPNGLRYAIIENPASEVVSLQVWLSCGSVNEKKNEYGVSHFIEHLLFKGTRHHKSGEVASSIECLGGDLNAFTSKEHTCYYVTIPSMYFKEALTTINDLVFHPTFDSDEMDLEREVILEEIKRYQDIPNSVASDNFFEIHFKGHPYSRTVIGEEDIIKSIPRKDILNYYKKFYSADNALLVICGNIEKAAAEKNVKELFCDIKRSTAKKIKTPQVKAKSSFASKIGSMDVKEAVFEFGFPIPGLLHKDVPALDVLSIILGQGESSRLFKSLRLDKGLVTGIGSYAYTPKAGGSFSIFFSMENISAAFNRKFDEIVECIGLEIKKIKEHGISGDEVEKAKTILLSDKVYERETVEGLARKIGHMISTTGGIKFEDEYFKELKKVDADMITKVLTKYLNLKGLSVSGIVNKTTSLNDDDVERIFKTRLDVSNIKKITNPRKRKHNIKSPMGSITKSSGYNFGKDFLISEPEMIVHKSGAKIVMRKVDTTPLISMRVILPGGTICETEANQGMSMLISRTLTFDAGRFSFPEIADTIDGTASSLNAFSGRNSIGLSLEAMTPFLDKMLDVTGDVLLDPRFNKAYFDVEKKVMEDDIRATEDNLARYANMLLLKTIYQKHPYRFELHGTVASISSIKRQDALSFYKSMLDPKRMIFSVVGDFNREHILKWIDGVVSKIEHNGSKPLYVTPEPEQKFPRISMFKKESKQAHIFLAYKTCDIRSMDRYVLSVLSSVLSGQSGRLFINLRDKQSLAYTVTPVDMLGADPGYFGIYIASETSKTARAIEEIRKELHRIKAEKIDDEELKRAKNFIIGRHAIAMQAYGEQSANMGFDEFYGLGFDSIFNYSSKILNVTSKDVMAVANKYFDDDKENIAIVSNDPEIL